MILILCIKQHLDSYVLNMISNMVSILCIKQHLYQYVLNIIKNYDINIMNSITLILICIKYNIKV